jgi:hypothetical protein
MQGTVASAASARPLDCGAPNDVIDQVLGELGHALAAAGGAEASALTGEGDQAVEAALAAVHAGETVGEDAAFEERT